METTEKKQPKLLIVDDDKPILDALKLFFTLEGYQVETNTGEALLECIADFQPNVMILDIWLAGESGIEISQQLKRNAKTSHMKILLISASRHLPDSATAALADDFVEKPFELSVLLGKVKALLAQ